MDPRHRPRRRSARLPLTAAFGLSSLVVVALVALGLHQVLKTMIIDRAMQDAVRSSQFATRVALEPLLGAAVARGRLRPHEVTRADSAVASGLEGRVLSRLKVFGATAGSSTATTTPSSAPAGRPPATCARCSRPTGRRRTPPTPRLVGPRDRGRASARSSRCTSPCTGPVRRTSSGRRSCTCRSTRSGPASRRHPPPRRLPARRARPALGHAVPPRAGRQPAAAAARSTTTSTRPRTTR